jgi:hypothetical protein
VAKAAPFFQLCFRQEGRQEGRTGSLPPHLAPLDRSPGIPHHRPASARNGAPSAVVMPRAPAKMERVSVIDTGAAPTELDCPLESHDVRCREHLGHGPDPVPAPLPDDCGFDPYGGADEGGPQAAEAHRVSRTCHPWRLDEVKAWIEQGCPAQAKWDVIWAARQAKKGGGGHGG